MISHLAISQTTLFITCAKFLRVVVQGFGGYLPPWLPRETGLCILFNIRVEISKHCGFRFSIVYKRASSPELSSPFSAGKPPPGVFSKPRSPPSFLPQPPPPSIAHREYEGEGAAGFKQAGLPSNQLWPRPRPLFPSRGCMASFSPLPPRPSSEGPPAVIDMAVGVLAERLYCPTDSEAQAPHSA